MKKFTWGHGIVLAMLSFMGFILFMIFVYSSGKQKSELITEDYYEQELAFQDVIDAKNNADALTEKPLYEQNKFQIAITFPKEYTNDNTTFNIHLYRPEDGNLDVESKMTLDYHNRIVIPAKVMKKGDYMLKLKWTKDNKNYQIDYDIVW